MLVNEEGATRSGLFPDAVPVSSAHRLRETIATYDVVLYGFVLSRLTLLAIGLLTLIEIRPLTTHGNALQLSTHTALNLWGAWDTGWYVDLALHGYQQTVGRDGQANWAFFPAYPALARTISYLTGVSVFEAMLVVSNTSFFAALILIHRLACAEFDKRTADVTVTLLCVAPGSYIFSSAYTESLFLLCLTGSFALIRSRKWLAAGIVAAAAVLTRNVGAGLLLAFGWAVLTRFATLMKAGEKPMFTVPELARIAGGILAPIVAVLLLMLYLHARTGDALAFVHVQKGWGRSFGNPFADLLAGLVYPAKLQPSDLVNFVAAWLAIGLLIVLIFLRRPLLLLLALFLTMVPLAAGIASFARYALVILPLWLVAADYLGKRPKAAVAAIAVLSMVNGFMMVTWTLALRIAT